MYIVGLDAGNSGTKAKSESGEVSFPSVFKEITKNDYEKAQLRGGSEATTDYFHIGDAYFVIGDTAMKQGVEMRQHGRSRYEREFYSVPLGVALFRLYERNARQVYLFASHAPQDVDYREQIQRASEGIHEVECAGVKHIFNVKTTRCFDEPYGGLYNVLLTQEGTRYARTDLRRGRILVIDVGGYTLDTVIMEDGQIDYMSETTMADRGILNIERQLKRLIDNAFRDKFARSNPPTPARIRESIHTGILRAGGYGELDVIELVREAAAPVLNDITAAFLDNGGVGRLEWVLLTGGGCGLMEPVIRERLGHPNVILADDSKSIHMANVRGGMKMAKAMKAKGQL